MHSTEHRVLYPDLACMFSFDNKDKEDEVEGPITSRAPSGMAIWKCSSSTYLKAMARFYIMDKALW